MFFPDCQSDKNGVMAAEIWFIAQRKNRVRYDFDQKFPKGCILSPQIKRFSMRGKRVFIWTTRLGIVETKETGPVSQKLVYENMQCRITTGNVMYKEAEDQTDRVSCNYIDGLDWKWFSVNFAAWT